VFGPKYGTRYDWDQRINVENTPTVFKYIIDIIIAALLYPFVFGVQRQTNSRDGRFFGMMIGGYTYLIGGIGLANFGIQGLLLVVVIMVSIAFAGKKLLKGIDFVVRGVNSASRRVATVFRLLAKRYLKAPRVKFNDDTNTSN
jgi:hypothetical protein